jgi:hypothetical protein
MNTPAPPPQTPTQNSLPTAGALIGSVLGSVVANQLKLDPVAAGSLIAGVTTFVTALFHFLGTKLGVPL